MYFSRNAALAVFAFMLASCASHKSAVVTSTGATVVASPEATMAAPVYPGAQYKSVDAKALHATLALFTTNDSFARVYDFYRTQLPKGSQTAKVVNPSSSVAAFEIQDLNSRGHATVTISAKSGETDILIVHGTSNGQLSASAEATE